MEIVHLPPTSLHLPTLVPMLTVEELAIRVVLFKLWLRVYNKETTNPVVLALKRSIFSSKAYDTEMEEEMPRCKTACGANSVP